MDGTYKNKVGKCPGHESRSHELGLSIVKGFIEAQGGTVSAENRTNGGARFVIKMPSPVPNINLE